jgi:hypothetical protein
MAHKTISTYVDVEVDLDDFDDDDLIDILEDRGYTINQVSETDLPAGVVLEDIKELYQLHRNGKDCERILNQLFYNALGKIV